jgi:hypothetical protein
MDPVRFAALLDAYGADPARWPEDERPAALALLEASADARARQRDAAALDAVLDTAPPARPSDLLVARVLAAAPGAAARTTAGARTRPIAPRRLVGRIWRYTAAAASLAAAAALALWLASAPQPTAPLSDEVLAELSVYGTPGDTLLDVTDVELLGDDEWIDCEAGGLGCLDTDVEGPDVQSDVGSERSYS